MKKEAEKLKSAAEWQGTDMYAGIDSYEKVDLKPGMRLYALVNNIPSGEVPTCEYFFDKSALDKVGFDATQLNQGLQISPRTNGNDFAYYKAEVIQFEVKEQMQVETGKTAENTAYGQGGMTQYYMPAQHFKEAMEKGVLRQVPFGNSSQVLFLDNLAVSKAESDMIDDKHDQLLLRRNLFCHQKAKLDTLDIIQNSPSPTDVVKAVENLEKLNGNILKIKKKISESVQHIGPVHSPLYDSLNKQLTIEIKYREMHPDALVLSNVKLKGEESRTTQEVLDKNNLNVVIDNGRSKVDEVSENLFKKMDDYKPENKWNDIDVKAQGLEEVMNINQINQESKELMQATELRHRDFSKVDTLAFQGTDGRLLEYKLSDHFTEESVKKIQCCTNGAMTEPLQMKDGRVAKLYLEGNKAQLFLSKDKEQLKQQVDNMPLEQHAKASLLAGDSVMCKNVMVKIDNDLSAIVPAHCASYPSCNATMYKVKQRTNNGKNKSVPI